jgi:DNA-binding MarR family transcriptional regulator
LKLCENVVRAWNSLVRAEQSLRGQIEDALKRAGLPPMTWYDVLNELDRAPDGRLRQSDVQSKVLLAQYNLCRLADRLQADGLIERQPCSVDGRSNVLVITEAGRELRRAMWPVYAEAIATHVAARLAPEEARTLADILGKLGPPAS